MILSRIAPSLRKTIRRVAPMALPFAAAALLSLPAVEAEARPGNRESAQAEIQQRVKRHRQRRIGRHLRRHVRRRAVPELDATSAAGAAALVLGGALVLIGRRRKNG